MEFPKFKVTDDCVGCMACVEVAGNNFEMGASGMAFVKKQPQTQEELEQTLEAVETCPVGAIVEIKEREKQDLEPVLSTSNVKEILDKYPKLKDVLIELSPKFKRLLNPALYTTLARFATFNDAARVTKVSICEILHTINKYLGTEEELIKKMPECIQKQDVQQYEYDEITWQEPPERYVYTSENLTEFVEKISNLKPQDSIVIISVEEPVELVKIAKGLGFKVNLEKGREYRLSVFNPAGKEKNADWRENKDRFEILDVRYMPTDPFDIIMKKAYELNEGEGFTLVQTFEPYPLINMLTEMGFDYEIERVSANEVKVYFYKKPQEGDKLLHVKNKREIVLQSATPVAYPVIMRLLQSEKIRSNFRIKQLKVWEETEKHLAWITSGIADISFSALITSIRLQKLDIKIPALFVWDNFVLLTRYPAKDFSDIRGKVIYLPLFEAAPPAKITRYLIKASGLNLSDFYFAFGKPFGRPEQIYRDFVLGKIDTAVLREPEASYAIKIMQDRNEKISVISYNDLWNKVNPGFGSFPNAGVVIKGEFVRKNPELTEMFLNELKDAVDWVMNNKDEAANLAFDIMRQPPDRVRLFLERVNFNYVSGKPLVDKVKKYFDLLVKNDIIDTEIDPGFYEVFTLPNKT